VAVLTLVLATTSTIAGPRGRLTANNPNPPTSPVKPIFIHHSCGGHWLTDVGEHGLSQRLRIQRCALGNQQHIHQVLDASPDRACMWSNVGMKLFGQLLGQRVAWKILISSDHLVYRLKEDLREYLEGLGHEAVDMGCDSPDEPVDYPDMAQRLARRIADRETDRGILICGTGIGMAIVANKVPGVRAAVCHDPYSAQRARASNDAQVIAFGARIVAPTLARKLLDVWLAAEFQGGRSLPKVRKIKQIDTAYRR
jgi:ribose 5-phosphate isomerase B